jgi:hypothetical protein
MSAPQAIRSKASSIGEYTLVLLRLGAPVWRQSGSDRRSDRRLASPRQVCLIAEVESPDSLGISSAAISNEQICQLVCRTSCACVAGGCVQIDRPPDPHRGRASATDSRRPAKATSRMDRARRRVSHVRVLRGAPEATPRNLCVIGPSRSCPQHSTLNTQLPC